MSEPLATKLFFWTPEGALLPAETNDGVVVAWLQRQLGHSGMPHQGQLSLVHKIESVIATFKDGIELP